MSLTARNRRSENIIVEAVVVSELKLRDIQRQIFAADFVEATDDSALEDRPEAFNRVRVDYADDMLPDAMIDNTVWISAAKSFIDLVGIGAEQANFIGNRFADKVLDFRLVYAENDAGDYVALALDCADDWGLERIIATPSSSAALVPMTVFIFAADVGFVHFDNAAELNFRLDKSSADFVAHAPSGFVAAKTHKPHDLKGAHPLFAGQHQVSNLEPVAERLVRIFKDSSGDTGEPIALRRTGSALPMEGLVGGSVVKVGIAATRANDALGPSTGNQIPLAGFLVPDWEHDLKLGAGQLVDGFWTLAHGSFPNMEGYNHA